MHAARIRFTTRTGVKGDARFDRMCAHTGNEIWYVVEIVPKVVVFRHLGAGREGVQILRLRSRDMRLHMTIAGTITGNHAKSRMDVKEFVKLVRFRGWMFNCPISRQQRIYVNRDAEPVMTIPRGMDDG